MIPLLCACDSLFTKLFRNPSVAVFQIYEAGTGSTDSAIAETICCAAVKIVLIIVVGFLIWKGMELFANYKAEKTKRVWDKNCSQLKMRNDLIEKHIDALKSQALVKNADGKIIGYKEEGSDEFKAYDKALEKYIGQSIVGKSNGSETPQQN